MTNTKFLDVDYDDEYQNNIIRTCLTDSQKSALEAAAKKHGWSLSREIRFRIQATLSNKMDFYDNELFEFRQAKNSINKLGINLHFILQKDNGRILDKDGFRQDINGLQNEIAELKIKLEKYIELGRGRQKQNAIGG
ncbi:DNA distortion polypeptide 1 domain protein [Salmonella enterica]|nr:DNA distortion polypeptide 1 domain protein [Salmonella enterica]EFQ4632149.1 DNA distortion polypeptide 1 domain protein [Salmonella enterica]